MIGVSLTDVMALAGRKFDRPGLQLLLHKYFFVQKHLLQRLHPVVVVGRHRFLLRVMPFSLPDALRELFVECFPGEAPFSQSSTAMANTRLSHGL